MGASDDKAEGPHFYAACLGRRNLFLLSSGRAVFYQLKHLVFAVHAEFLIDVRRMQARR